MEKDHLKVQLERYEEKQVAVESWKPTAGKKRKEKDQLH